jgi:hypothetical protein
MGYLRNLATAGNELVRAALSPLYGRPAGEQGHRVAADVALRRLYQQFSFSTEVRAKIVMLRDMELRDGRVKAIHGRVCRDTIRGGLVMQFSEGDSSDTLRREWLAFARRLSLDRAQKLRSDARGLVCEGNLPLQLVLNADATGVAAAVRMPAETIVPLVDDSGRFANPMAAYEQRDVVNGRVLASFAAWQLQLARYDPLSFDDMGEMGRPFLDAVVGTWRKLVMTEEDLVIRRRTRAPLRMAHVLEGADDATLSRYRQTVEGEKGEVTTDFYLNRKGGVTPVQGDANLDHINDVVHLLDSFFAGTGVPKGLMGYTEGLARDVLEDLKRDYYDEIDHVQDTLAWEYEQVFRIHLLFKGIVAGPEEFSLRVATRRTETPNQVADLGLKLLGLGLPPPMVWEEMGYDPATVLKAVEAWGERADPYPGAGALPVPGLPPAPPGAGGGAGGAGGVKVTPGNGRKGESATAVPVPGSNRGRGRG